MVEWVKVVLVLVVLVLVCCLPLVLWMLLRLVVAAGLVVWRC